MCITTKAPFMRMHAACHISCPEAPRGTPLRQQAIINHQQCPHRQYARKGCEAHEGFSDLTCIAVRVTRDVKSPLSAKVWLNSPFNCSVSLPMAVSNLPMAVICQVDAC